MRSGLITLAALVVLAGVAGWLIGYDRIGRKLQSVAASMTIDRSKGEAVFPTIDKAALSDTQYKILTLAKREFEMQSKGETFSDGQREAWCANFVSWVMNEAGVPLKNPHSGSWRIPGTYTLMEYYQDAYKFRPVDSGYVPQPGDVAVYRGSPVFGDHTNIVISYRDGVLTTVGGNENNRIRVYKNSERQYDGLLGYGILERV